MPGRLPPQIAAKLAVRPRGRRRLDATRARLPVEVIVVWVLLAADAAAILVTYGRLPARALYHVTGTGLGGGASRALVFANFPVAPAAIAVLGVVGGRGARPLRVAAAGAAVLCAAVFWPGVVTQADLDARPVNAIAAAGVLIALVLTIAVARAGVDRTGPLPGDRLRAALAIVLVAVALPWIAADAGFFLDGVPLLGRVFVTGARLPHVVGVPPAPPAVHHGHHHGLDGLLLAATALLLSRTVAAARGSLRGPLSAYLSLMLCYGVANMANDAWDEQVFKRGWSGWQFPSVTTPAPSAAWGVLVAAAAGVWLVAFRSGAGSPGGAGEAPAVPPAVR